MTDHSNLQPLSRLLRDLNAVGRLERDDHVPASERAAKAIGPELFDVVRRALLGPEARARRVA